MIRYKTEFIHNGRLPYGVSSIDSSRSIIIIIIIIAISIGYHHHQAEKIFDLLSPKQNCIFSELGKFLHINSHLRPNYTHLVCLSASIIIEEIGRRCPNIIVVWCIFSPQFSSVQFSLLCCGCASVCVYPSDQL